MFLFQLSVAHRYLHSFPTRRSSDLITGRDSSSYHVIRTWPIGLYVILLARDTGNKQAQLIFSLSDSTRDTVLLGGYVSRKDRKSTRLNSSHRCISYAVFCLKKKHEHGYHRRFRRALRTRTDQPRPCRRHPATRICKIPRTGRATSIPGSPAATSRELRNSGH